MVHGVRGFRNEKIRECENRERWEKRGRERESLLIVQIFFILNIHA